MHFPWEASAANQTPHRVTAIGTAPQKPDNTWRQAVGTFLAIGLALTVLFSLFVLLVYVSRESELYDELTDYLDKTVSISKINYNPLLGNFEIHQSELNILSEQRQYKSLMYMFLFADAATLFFVTVCILLYYTSDLHRGNMALIFWLFLVVGSLYATIESSTFSALVYPYASRLPNATEILLDRSIPYNPGGVIQMETRLGCTFNQNLYNVYQRRQNQRNTCDPQIMSSFISTGLLVTFIVLRLVVIVSCSALLLVPPVGRTVGHLISLTRPKDGYRAKYIKNSKSKASGKHFGFESGKSTTTFDANEKRPPIISSPIDHTLSYNNAAYFATANAVPNTMHNGSSRSSEIDAADLYNHHQRINGSIHTQNSLVSEV
ncbi:hypothetical protein M3Y97_00131000 [Aphelenchoides bicaudatus]|nr:hypothetical protein M3Y97_00131000 [Aphelenchoides bicaudatus]